MAEYTYKDIIIDPNSEEAKNAVGKEVFFDNMPYYVVVMANANANGSDLFLPEVLKDVIPGLQEPFRSESGNSYSCIILKKEEPKPKYVPFESIEEFLTAYFKSVANSECIQKTISSTGIWLKHNDAFLLVVEIWDRGVVIGDINMQTTEIDEDEYLTVHGVTKWKELLEDCTFLNGSPCGKEVK